MATVPQMYKLPIFYVPGTVEPVPNLFHIGRVELPNRFGAGCCAFRPFPPPPQTTCSLQTLNEVMNTKHALFSLCFCGLFIYFVVIVTMVLLVRKNPKVNGI